MLTKHRKCRAHHRPSQARLFRNTILRIEAVSELLAMLIRGVVGKHFLARGALESLEAGFALDGLRRCVLCDPLG